MTNPVANSKKQEKQQPSKQTPRKEPTKARDSKTSDPHDKSGFPSGWAFAT